MLSSFFTELNFAKLKVKFSHQSSANTNTETTDHSTLLGSTSLSYFLRNVLESLSISSLKSLREFKSLYQSFYVRDYRCVFWALLGMPILFSQNIFPLGQIISYFSNISYHCCGDEIQLYVLLKILNFINCQT